MLYTICDKAWALKSAVLRTWFSNCMIRLSFCGDAPHTHVRTHTPTPHTPTPPHLMMLEMMITMDNALKWQVVRTYQAPPQPPLTMQIYRMHEIKTSPSSSSKSSASSPSSQTCKCFSAYVRIHVRRRSLQCCDSALTEKVEDNDGPSIDAYVYIFDVHMHIHMNKNTNAYVRMYVPPVNLSNWLRCGMRLFWLISSASVSLRTYVRNQAAIWIVVGLYTKKTTQCTKPIPHIQALDIFHGAPETQPLLLFFMCL